jgi:mannosyltransferase
MHRRLTGSPALLLALITAAGAVLRFATLSTQSFWLDEAIAINSARLDIGGMIDSLARTEGNPPLYFLLLDGWMRLFGTSEAAVRSLSAVIGTATILLAYEIGRRLATVRIGLVLAAVAAFNPLLVWFSQEARPYGLLVLLSGASFLCFAEALRARPAGRWLAAWAVASGLAMATHYFAGLLILPEAAWLLYRVRPLRPVLLAVGGFALVPLALVPLVARQGQVQDYSFVKGEAFLTRVFAQVPKQWMVGYDAPAETFTVIVAAVLVLVGVVLAVGRARERERDGLKLAVALGAAVCAIGFVMALLGADYYLSRYMLAAWLPLALGVAIGFGARRSGRLGIVAAGALCALSLYVVVSGDARPELQRDDWRGVARALGKADGPRVIVVSPINGSIPLGLYLPLRKLTAATNVQEVDAVAVAPRIAGQRRHAPAVRVGHPPLGFTEMSRHQGATYTVVRYQLQAVAPITPALVADFALLGGSPDYVVEPHP